ncbi:MAG: RluA family pseudouridine synthase [Pseudomonadota bacterium]
METLTVLAEERDGGQRVDRFLAQRLAPMSRSRIKALIKAGAARCDGAPLSDPNAPVRPGSAYALDLPAPRPALPQPEAIALDILHEDADLIVVNKAAGMAVHPAPGTWSGTLVNALLHHCSGDLPGIGGVERPGIVHRLDKDTSGVLVVAKTEAAHRGLSQLFAAHDIDRVYSALTRGAPRPLSGTIDAPIARAPHDRKKMAVALGAAAGSARHAITHYKTCAQFGRLEANTGLPAAALIECRLETGRTHQIRVHMAHHGAPLIGDPTYGRGRGIKAHGSGEAFQAATQAARQFKRQALHAARLGFVHPVTGRTVTFEAPLPGDMADLSKRLDAMPAD